MANVKAPAAQENKPLVKFQNEFNQYSDEIKAILPSTVSFDKFKQVVIFAVQDNPELLTTNTQSLLKACRNCAKDGLIPDGEEAALVIYKSDTYGKTTSYIPMVKGMIKRMWESKKIIYLSANAVYDNDFFEYILGDKEGLVHKPELENRGNVKAAYAIVKNISGEYMRCILGKDEIEKLRRTGKAAEKLFWTKWYDQMAIKSAIHRLTKMLNLDVEFEAEEYNEIEAPSVPKLAAPPTLPALPATTIPAQVLPPPEQEIKQVNGATNDTSTGISKRLY